MGGLKRAERNWGGVGTLGGEAKERKVVGDALADGVVLCLSVFLPSFSPSAKHVLVRDES